MGKSETAFGRAPELFDTTLGWRFINPELDKIYGTDSMMQTAENIADMLNISREDQDAFAFRSQQKAADAQQYGLYEDEIIDVVIPQRKGEPIVITTDEHPRLSSIEKLANLRVLTRKDGTITAGNASGINDGAAALIIASAEAVKRFNLNPIARISGMSVAGVPPRIMGMGPVPATKKLLARLGLSLSDFQLLELNEAFAAQALGCLRQLEIPDDDPRVNPLGGAIALGHPLGMSGARLLTTATYQLKRNDLNKALCTMCIGVGQGIATVIESV